ncbi:MAG TPA: substrate-binding domain-containing protein [Flavihumibacter sp.]|jgi:phosphate transport system substrate-binding protein
MHRRWKIQVFVILVALGFVRCNNQPVVAHGDTPKSGTIHISVDESFKPVIDSQIKVYESDFPNAKIIAHYKPEAECLKDLLVDSIRMVIVTRGLLPEEEKGLKEKLRYVPIQGRAAFDAVTVIVNPANKDSILDRGELRSILNGTSGYKFKPVMDGLTATSTVRFAIDSILKGEKLSPEVTAATSSEGVIDYVSKNKDAIGFIGVSWIGNTDDPVQLSFQQKVTIASLRCEICPNEAYVKPYQANIATRRYPLVRGLHYILKENWQGLGSGFANFLIYERGQLIFRRAYLWPAKMAFEIRNAGIDE